MSPKQVSVIFLVICLTVRCYRSHLQPLIARLLPRKISAELVRGLDSVEHLATHELVAIVEHRLKQDAADEARHAQAKDAVQRVAAAILKPPPKP